MILASVPALASPFDLVSLSSESAGVAGAGSGVESGGMAAWTNPGALTLTQDFEIGVAWSCVWPRFSADVVDAGSLPALLSTKGVGVREAATAAADIGYLGDLVLAGKMPLSRLLGLGREVTFGGVVLLPGSGSEVVEVLGPTPDQLTFPWLGQRLERLLASVSVGVEVLPKKLSVGAGVAILADISGSVVSSTPIAVFSPDHPDSSPAPAASKASFHQVLATDIAPVVGVLWRPVEPLSLGLSFRGGMSLDLHFSVRAGVFFDLGGVPIQADIPFHLQGSYFYLPSELTLSVAGQPWKFLSLKADLAYRFTSTFKDHLPVTHFFVDQEAVGPNGELKALSNLGTFRVTEDPAVKASTRDTLVPRVGAEFRPWPFLAFRAGYAYYMSPLVPDQGYRNMLLDSGYHQVAAGVSADFGGALLRPLTIALHGDAAILNRRYNQVGRVDASGERVAAGVVKTRGYALGGGASVTVRF